jgi:hypothetical protein
MITKSKLALIAAIAVMTVTSSAFAQSYDPSVGTGNVQNDQIAAGRSGLRAFARVPRGERSDDDYNPATSGYDHGIETRR